MDDTSADLPRRPDQTEASQPDNERSKVSRSTQLSQSVSATALPVKNGEEAVGTPETRDLPHLESPLVAARNAASLANHTAFCDCGKLAEFAGCARLGRCGELLSSPGRRDDCPQSNVLYRAIPPLSRGRSGPLSPAATRAGVVLPSEEHHRRGPGLPVRCQRIECGVRGAQVVISTQLVVSTVATSETDQLEHRSGCSGLDRITKSRLVTGKASPNGRQRVAERNEGS